MNDAVRHRGGWRIPFALIALLPALSAALLVRPVAAGAAESPRLSFYAVTLEAAAVATDGDAGLGGGIAPLDSGVPFLAARLDSSPSANARAAAVEPGTLARTAAAIVNDEAGEIVVDIPLAEANHPGEAVSVEDLLGSTEAGPFHLAGLQARAEADAGRAGGRALLGEQAVLGGTAVAASIRDGLRDGLRRALVDAGIPALTAQLLVPRTAATPALVRIEQGLVEGEVRADPQAGTIEGLVTSQVARVVIADTLVFEGVRGTASITLDEDGEQQAEAGLVVGGLRIADVPFELSTDGLVAGPESIVPDEILTDLGRQAGRLLADQGISFEVLDPVEDSSAGDAEADSRGLRIDILTPTLADGGVPANHLTLVLGQAALTASSEGAQELPAPPPPPPPGTDPAPAAPTAEGPFPTAGPDLTELGPGVGFPPVTPPSGDPQAPVATPDVAPAPADPQLLLAGRPVDRRLVLGALGAWQLLSLSACTAAAVVLRRREVLG